MGMEIRSSECEIGKRELPNIETWERGMAYGKERTGRQDDAVCV